MANLISRNGWYSIRFYHPKTGKRCTIATRTKDEKAATLLLQRIESVVGSVVGDYLPDPATMAWIGSTSNRRFRKALIDLELVPEGAKDRKPVRLSEFLKDYESRRVDAKPLTLKNWQKAFKNLAAFFGEKKPINEITPSDARDYERHLKSNRRKSKRTRKSENESPPESAEIKPLAPATIAKHIQHAKQFFADAFERGLIESNPFEGLKVAKGKNRSREFFVTREMTAKIIEACPDSQWRLIVALARFGGLRCPSEVLALTWDHVDWEKKRLRVPSQKTEHHEGGGERTIPLFPELSEPLKDCFDLAGVGIETPSSSRIITRYGSPDQNLRTTFTKIIRRAKLKLWPKLFQNLRASRATELVQDFPQHVAAAWLGHSIRVAAEHYWQIRESDFERATSARSHFVPCDDPETGFPEFTKAKNPAKSGVQEHLVAGAGLEPARPKRAQDFKS